MLIYPAIDIMNGKVVRLYQGDYGKVKQYAPTCLEAAQDFASQGAKYLHAVDLDGAKTGRALNACTVKEIIAKTALKLEIGGGIRSERQIAEYLEAGAQRVVLGTIAVRDFGFVREMAKKYPDRIAVGVDARNGRVAVSGWREITEIDSLAFCKQLAEAGVENIIYTDISRDGTLSGTDPEIYRKLVQIKGLKVSASGGITTLEEIDCLKTMGVHAAVLGKAVYEGRLSLAEAVRRAEE